jgi:hypothetical protein
VVFSPVESIIAVVDTPRGAVLVDTCITAAELGMAHLVLPEDVHRFQSAPGPYSPDYSER